MADPVRFLDRLRVFRSPGVSSEGFGEMRGLRSENIRGGNFGGKIEGFSISRVTVFGGADNFCGRK